MQQRALIVDDEEMIRNVCSDVAEDVGMKVSTAATTEEALYSLKKESVDVLVTDVRIPEIGGMELIKRTRASHPEVGIIVLTGHGTIEMAVSAIKSGVLDFITKPFLLGDFQEKLRDVAHTAECNRGHGFLLESFKNNGPSSKLIGRSTQIQEIQRLITRVSNHEYPVLILGETGTGKEVTARAIHFSGLRATSPFIAVDCASLTPSLIESELFGHEKGSFTGATQSRKGLIEVADRGTLFLDEIGELPKEFQCKLLRVLQEGEVRRVGALTTTRVNVRVIAATNRDLKKEVQEGRFREDLYFRLNVVEICLPPLRARPRDIPILVSAFLEKCSSEWRQITCVSPGIWPRLANYSWPGNVRELENTIERAVALGSGPVLKEEDVLLTGEDLGEHLTAGRAEGVVTLENLEKNAVLQALEETRGDKAAAAQLLGIGKTTLYRKLKEYGSRDSRRKLADSN